MPDEVVTTTEAQESAVTTPSAAEKAPESMKQYMERRLTSAETSPAPETGISETEEEKAAKEAAKKAEGKGGFQRRIDKLTKKSSALEEALEAERTARQTLEARLAGKPVVAESKSEDDPEPNFEEMSKKGKSYEEFVKAQARWEARQELKEARAKEAEATRQGELKKNWDAHLARMAKAATEIEDFSDTLAEADLTIPPAAYNAIVEDDNGPKIAYYLAQHPEAIEKLRELKSETRQAAEIGKLSAQLSAEPSKSPKPKPVSTVSAPIEPVGGSQAKSTKPLGEMSMRDYMKARQAGRTR